MLVAEFMLQQTSAGQVLDVYGDLVQKYPKPEPILDTPQEELADDIESLGLRKRTRYFRETSEQLVEDHNSTVPILGRNYSNYRASENTPLPRFSPMRSRRTSPPSIRT